MTRVYALLALLTVAAGYLDAVSFFGLGVFTANMTGNTVLLAGALVARFVPHTGASFSVGLTALSLGCFVAGAAAAAFALRGETGRPPLRTRGAMAGVALLLAVCAVLFVRDSAAAVTPYCVALLSVVAGIQSVVAARAGVPGITTIVVTGTMVTALIDFFGGGGATKRQAGVPYAAAWVLYLAGGAVGALGLALLGRHALWPAAAIVAISLTMV